MAVFIPWKQIFKAGAKVPSGATLELASGSTISIAGTLTATGKVAAAHLANDAVETAKIKDANVTTAKIADANVTTAKIADVNVTAAKLAANAVETAKILDANVTTAKLVDAGVTPPKTKTKAAIALADADATLTAAQMVDSGIFTITPTTARTLTTDTAANLVAAMPGYQIGTWFDIIIVCLAAFAVTLAGGVGITIVGNAVVNNDSGTWRARFDSASAVTLYRM